MSAFLALVLLALGSGLFGAALNRPAPAPVRADVVPGLSARQRAEYLRLAAVPAASRSHAEQVRLAALTALVDADLGGLGLGAEDYPALGR